MKVFVLCLAAAITSLGATLPNPNGAFSVGTRVLAPVVDRTRPDARFPSGARTIGVQLWYPADRPTPRSLSPYVPEPEILDFLEKGSSHSADLEPWRGLTTAASVDAPIGRGRFPLLLFSEGMGMSRFFYTVLLEELASRGFVVASIDHPDIAPVAVDHRVIAPGDDAPRPRFAVASMAADFEVVSQRLIANAKTFHIDPAKVAVAGHSIGGAAALEACRTNRRFLACVDIDGSAFGDVSDHGVGRPFLLILNEPIPPIGGKMAQGRRDEWKAVIDQQKDDAPLLVINGSNHMSFTDAAFVRPSLLEGTGAVTDASAILRTTADAVAEYVRSSFARRPAVFPAAPFVLSTSLRSWAETPANPAK